MRHAFVLVALLATVTFAQTAPVRGGHLVFTDSNPPSVSVYDLATQTVSVVTPAMNGLTVPSGCFVTDQRDIVFGDFIGVGIHRVDILGTQTTLAPGLLNNPIRITQDYNGDFIFTGNAWAYAPSSLMRVDGAGNVTTVAVLAGNPFDVIRDPSGISNSGDFIVTAPLLGEVMRIDGAGMISVLATGLPGPLGIDRFANGDFAVAMQFTDEILRIPRNGGTPTVFVASGTGLGNVKDVISDHNGGFYITEAGGALGSRIMHVDAAGTITQVLGNSAFGLLQAACLSPTLIAPTNVNTGPTAGLFGVQVDIPADANLPYMAFMSGSAYPGIQFPGADPRGSVLNPDPLFLGTFGVGAPGITTGWIGSLDGSGSAVILIDLTPYPVGLFSGGRVHLQVATLDMLAPTGISNLSSPSTLAFP